MLTEGKTVVSAARFYGGDSQARYGFEKENRGREQAKYEEKEGWGKCK